MLKSNGGNERKAPKTLAKCREEIVERLKWSREYIARLKRTGEYEKYANRTLNPNGLAEMIMGCRATARDFKAARELEAQGIIVVVSGSLDGYSIRPGDHWPDAYILEGPNFPKA